MHSSDDEGMKNICVGFALVFSALAAGVAQEAPPKHEIGLTLGGLLSNERTATATRLDLQSGVAFQVNYGYRFWTGYKAALYAEAHLLVNPLRDISSSDTSLTRNVATLFVTPGLRLKFAPNHRVSPYIAAGGGWADYEQSTATLAGDANPSPRTVNHGVFDYGGGLDFKLWRFLGLRAEVRDFYGGSPAYNASSLRGGQHNVVAGGGLVLQFH